MLTNKSRSYTVYVCLPRQQVILTEMNEVKKDVGDWSGMIQEKGYCSLIITV